MRATTTMPSGRMPMTIRKTRAVMSSGSRSPMWRSTCAPASRSMPRPENAAIPVTSPTAWCRCCRTGCQVICALCTRACRVPAWRCGCIDAGGEKVGHRFVRGLMRSAASLSYQQIQAAMDGAPDDACGPLMDEVIRPLYAAHDALQKARSRRQPLDLDLPERKVVLSDEGRVLSVNFADRLDAHKLIEECMVLANVAAAETLVARKSPLLFRVHEEPSPEKLDSLREVAEAAGLVLAKGQVLRTAHLNALLHAAQDTDHSEVINMSTLRAMTQAYYAPQNFGHFGLALQAYA